MGANEELGLPRHAMRKVVIAFDVDGTLRCNCTAICDDPNARICELLRVLDTMKNTKIVVWSGGGKPYAEQMVRRLGLSDVVKDSQCHAKLNYSMRYGEPDIAVDDIQDTDLGTINLIVREK